MLSLPKEGMIPIKARGTGFYRDEFFKRGEFGWKMHLAVQPQNHQLVYDWILDNSPYEAKYGRSDQIGKDFTIYIGSFDEAEAYALTIANLLRDYLEDVQGDAANEDIAITDKTAIRFDAGRTNPDFHQYGSKGIPFLNHDVSQRRWGKEKFNREEAMNRAYRILKYKYKEYFTGSKQQVEK